MTLILKIAWRNVFRQKRRTILTALAMFGGFTLSAISIGWSDGTYNRIIDMFTRNQLGHIQIHAPGYLDRPALYRNVKNYQQIGLILDTTQRVESWAPRLYSAGLASVGEKAAGVQIVGVDPARENVATNFDKKIIEGHSLSREPAHEALLGKGAAHTLKAGVGDEIVIVSQGADGSIANDLYTIVGIVESNNAGMDQTGFYLHLNDAQDLLVLDATIHEMVIVVTGLDDVEDVTENLRAGLVKFDVDVEPWQEFARSFYVAMQADKNGAWIMLAVIILVVAIGVLNTVLMTVLERTREYGVLRAMGTRPGQIFRLVLIEIGLMALISVIFGCGVSLILNNALSTHGIPMPQTFTYGGMEFSRYYSEVNAHSLYIPALTIILSAMLVSIFPAIRAARIAPAKAQRMH